MGLGRRSAPSAPPVPAPPLPPSAYGIAVPGAPVALQQQYPPPPTAPPPAAFAPASTFGPPPPAYGSPVWAPAGSAPARPGVRNGLAAAAVGVVVVLTAVLVVPRVLDELHRHHMTTLPASVGAYTQAGGSAAADTATEMQSSMPSKFKGKLTHLQVGIYLQGPGVGLLVVTSDVPAGTQHHPNEAFQNDDGTDDFHDVVAPASSFGGKVRCTSYPLAGKPTPACGWIDDGTFGLVFAPGSDEAGAIAMVAQVRAVAER